MLARFLSAVWVSSSGPVPGRSLVVPNQIRALALRKAELWPVEWRPQLRAGKACGWTHLAVSGCRFPSEQRIRRLIVASVSNKLILNKVAHESYLLLHKRDAAGLAVMQETASGIRITNPSQRLQTTDFLCITSHTAHIQHYNHACVTLLWNTLLEHIYH